MSQLLPCKFPNHKATLSPHRPPHSPDKFRGRTDRMRTAASRRRRIIPAALLVSGAVGAALLWCASCFAAQTVPVDSVLSRPIAMIVSLAAVSLVPFAFLTMTSFVKISTVLHIAKGALGAQSVPSNTVIMALAAALTVLAMTQVGMRIADRAGPALAKPASADTVEVVRELVDAVKEPLRDFLHANASATERARFLDLARNTRPPELRDDVEPTDLVVLIPSFMVTELTEAFALGFAIYLPFLVIDLVIANILLALGMQMLSPTQVSLPFKLLLFVGIDGWGLLARTLVMDYATK